MEHIFDLQRFAEESEESTEQQETEQQSGGADGEEQESSKDKKPEAKYSDADLDRIIGKKFAEWQSKKEKEMSEAKRLASMSAQEKAELEREKMQKQLDDLLRERQFGEMSKTARSMLADKDINVGDDLLSMLVADDAEKTKANVDNFSELFNATVKKAVADALKGSTPKTGKTSSGLTKEQIMKVKNRTERQRLINENWELFQ